MRWEGKNLREREGVLGHRERDGMDWEQSGRERERERDMAPFKLLYNSQT